MRARARRAGRALPQTGERFCTPSKSQPRSCSESRACRFLGSFLRPPGASHEHRHTANGGGRWGEAVAKPSELVATLVRALDMVQSGTTAVVDVRIAVVA